LWTREELSKYAAETKTDFETVAYLASLYGSQYTKVLDYAQRGARGIQPLCQHSKDITAEIWYAVAEESTYTVSDFMMRRSGLGLAKCQGLDAVEIVDGRWGNCIIGVPKSSSGK